MAVYTAAEYIEVQNPTLFAQTARMNFYIDIATDQTSATHFGDLYEQAIAYRAMHNEAIDGDPTRKDGSSGTVTNKREGSASISYKHVDAHGSHSDLGMTHWGQRLKALGRSRMPSISVSGDPNSLIPQITGSDL